MKNTVLKIWRFYVDGFRGMTLGRTLWFIILVKLFIMFFILRLFFFNSAYGRRIQIIVKEENAQKEEHDEE